ncbi:MAG TPA: rod shape-determining protein MreC [Chloroflexia bacterium]|nr:rod shape-determining protein MreC [Chloroflexia bacterium]
MKQKDRSLSWTRTLYLLVALVLVSLALIFLSQGRYLQPIESVAGQVLTPIQQAASDATSGIGSWIDAISRAKSLEEENAKIRAAFESVTAENAQLQELKRENEQLRAMLKFQADRPEIRGVLASNIGGDPTGLKEMLTIDKGSNAGIAPGMAVVSPGGILVGLVAEVKADRSTVLKITDVGSSIGVTTQRTQTPGVLEGKWQTGGRLLMRRIPRDADVKEGDILLTSGIGGNLPKGLIAGQILVVRQNDVQTDKEAEAYPLVELNSLEGVLVITSGAQK